MATHTNGSKTVLGAMLWLLNIQYYVIQVIVAFAFKSGYNWAHNTISDLGNTKCGMYGGRLVCSPLHATMNVSFIFLGVTICAGAFLLYRRFTTGWPTLIGFGCMGLAGLGTLLVGLYPENTVSSFHITGAALAFIFGNLGMIVLGLSIKQVSSQMRLYTMLSGIVGLIALILFQRHIYLGIGIGGMERITAYPQTIWMIVFGEYILRGHFARTEVKG
jgi:hypothetical membrane protein